VNSSIRNNKPKLKFIIFDIDGTLTDTTTIDDKCYINSFETLFETSIRKVNWSDLKNVTDWGIAEELVRIKLNREISNEELSKLKNLFVENLKMELELDESQFSEISGAGIFFKSLSINSNYQLGIATGGWEQSANLKLAAIGIDPNKTSYSNSSYFKSRELITEDVIKKIKRNTNKTPNEIIYFGDGEWDYLTCQKLGIRFIGIDVRKNGKLKKLGVSEIYNNFNNSEIIMKSIMNSSR